MRLHQLITLTAIVLLGFSASAQVTRKGMKPKNISTSESPLPPLYTTAQLEGKWQEMTRANFKNSPVSFTDSLLLNFSGGKVILRDAQSMNMALSGNAEIEAPATLNAGGSSFFIKKLDVAQMILQDGEFNHILQKVPEFMSDRVGKDSVKTAALVPVEPAMEALKGTWKIYRRQAAPGFITDSTLLIKFLTIAAGNGNTGSGEITLYNGQNLSESFPCVISIQGSIIKVNSLKGDLVLTVYKADATEFIFGNENGVVNYAGR